MLLKISPVYLSAAKAIKCWGDRTHTKEREFLADKMCFHGENGHQQLTNILNITTYNPSSPKRMSVDHLHVILEEVDDPAREKILSSLTEPHGYVLQKVGRQEANTFGVISVLKMVLHLDQKHGHLSEALGNAVEDEVIDEKEKQQLREITGEFRTLLRKLEAMLGEESMEEY